MKVLPLREFIAHGGGQNDVFKQNGQNVEAPDQDEIVDRAGIGDNELQAL